MNAEFPNNDGLAALEALSSEKSKTGRLAIARTVALVVFPVAFMLSGCSREAAQAEAHPEAAEKKTESHLSHGTNGQVIITLDAPTQKLMGLGVSILESAKLSPEVKAYGRVLDVSPLAALTAELITAQTAAEASEAELKRLSTLSAQNNASERALQTARAAAVHDRAQVEATRLRLISTWGSAIAQQKDLPAFVQTLSSLEASLVELEIPGGKTLPVEPTGARLLPLSNPSEAIPAGFLGTAPAVDLQLQARGFLFLVQSNENRLAPGAAVSGFITLPGQTQSGAVLPQSAVVRFAGTSWVYRKTGEQSFERTEVSLAQPLTNGWFIHEGLNPDDQVVTVGAQQLLSEELKGQGGEE